MADYIIVGGGSAGCVLANRLTEDPAVSVLLLEAGGPDRRKEISIPIAFQKLMKSDADWDYTTEPHPATNNRGLYWPRGKVLGGCSSTNAMVYMRGNRRDYDDWAAAGNRGWGYDDCLAYFRKSENSYRGASTHHGTGGPLEVSAQLQPNPISHAMIDAFVECGIPRSDDLNGPEQDGVALSDVTQKNGQRCSAARAYLHPAMKRPNLQVETEAHATRVVVRNGKATGVRYSHEGREVEATASREVILSGGAVNSPQLLLLSGIGPADELSALDIEAVHELPGVGKNLQDHIFLGMNYECTQSVTLDTAESLINLLRYLLFKSGPFTSNVAEVAAFVRTREDLDRPDLQFHAAPLYYKQHGFERIEGSAFSVGPILIHPKSAGAIRLKSADPFAPAVIQPNYLAEDDDARVMVEGVKLARRVASASSLQPYRGAELLPGADVNTDEEIAASIRAHCETLYHPAGTCKMGHDAMAVVDDELRVRGIDGLRVVDASIMPSIVGGNTNAPTIMIAEKAADLIRGTVTASDGAREKAAEPAIR